MDFSPDDPRNEIYARPDEHWKVFVSSKMRGGALAEEREAAVGAIEAFGLTKAWAWEKSAAAGPYYSVEECVRQAGTADAVVLILSEEITEVTRLEYEAAHTAKAPIFPLIKAGQDQSPELAEFIELLQRRGDTVGFSTTGELASRVTHALRTWALRAGRSEQLRAREGPEGPRRPGRAAAEAAKLPGADGEPIRVAAVFAKARQLVRESEGNAAAELLQETAQRANDLGLRWLAGDVLDALEEIVPSDEIEKRQQGWILNTRGLSFGDATGSSDEAIEAFSQMRQIGREIEDAWLESTALQNLGVMEVMAGRNESARAFIKESVDLRLASGELFGALQVVTNMVNVLVGEGELDRAQGLVDFGFEQLAGVRSPELRNTLYGHRSTIATERGDLLGARENLRLALAAARRAKSIPREILTMQNLGTNAADRGKPKEAARWYEKALAVSDSIKDRGQRRIQRQALAFVVMRAGDDRLAAGLFETAAEEAEELGDRSNAAIAIGDAAVCYLNSGEPQRAMELTTRALEVPGAREDEWRYGQLLNLAGALAQLERGEDAFETAIRAANLASGDWKLEARALGRAAEVATRLGTPGGRLAKAIDRELELRRKHERAPGWAWRAAEIASLLHLSRHSELAPGYYSLALRSYSARGDRRQVFFVRNDRAIARSDLGDLAGAAADVRACLKLADDLGDRFLAWQAHRNLGEIERRRGRESEARANFQTALELAAELGDVVAAGEILALLGLVETNAGNLDRAGELFAEAKRAAKEAHSQRLAASALKGEAQIAFLRGRHRSAARLYRRTVRLMDGEPSRQLVESLSGVIAVEAELGHLAEDEIEALDPLSRRLGWDALWIHELRGAFAAMLRSGGSFEEVVSLAALVLLISARPAEITRASDEEAHEEMSELLASGMMLLSWIREDQSGERRRGIIGAAEEVGGGKEAAELVEEVFRIAEDQPAVEFPWPRWQPR